MAPVHPQRDNAYLPRRYAVNSRVKEPLDKAIVDKLLLHAEQGIHRHGWDQAPFLATLEWIRPGALVLKSTAVEIQDPPGAFIQWLGQAHLDHPEVGQALSQDIGDRFFGFAFVCEAWQRETTELEEAKQWQGRSFADIPGSKEVRMINAVDIYARTYGIQRIRGEKPVSWSEGPVDVTGRVMQGLANMVLGAIRQMPYFADRLTDLETLFIASFEDQIAAQEMRRKRASHPEE